MSAGVKVDRLSTRLTRVAGVLLSAVTQKRLFRSELESVVRELEEIAEALGEILDRNNRKGESLKSTDQDTKR